jgi:hypothetical protein
LINETFRQLKIAFPSLKIYDQAAISATVYKDKSGYHDQDVPYVKSVEEGKSINIKSGNLYSVGTHSGFSDYSFTSFESAVTNAIHLYNLLENEQMKIKTPFTLRAFLFLVLIILILIYYMRKK